ncbi:MAG TPA: hypothetical protein DCQ50_12870 [Chryseobacterium sp.]|nr:hypothetical protein [Chryseobacterium sp.]
MNTKIADLILILIPVFLFGQSKVNAPFSLKDYEEMQIYFLDYVNKHSEGIIQIDDNYYDTKKLDSLLLIKNKFKKEKLLQEGINEAEIPKYIGSVKDDVVLPFAYFTLNKNGFNYTINKNGILNAERRNITILFMKANEKIVKFLESITDKDKEIVTSNIYRENGTLASTRSNNSLYGFGMGETLTYNEDGSVKESIDYDKGLKFTYDELKNNYWQKIEKYIKENPDKFNQYDKMELAKTNKGKTKISRFAFTISKEIRNGLFCWTVLINNKMFIFDGETGEIIDLKTIQYAG